MYPPHSPYLHAAAGGVGGHGSFSGGWLVGWLVESARFSGLWRFPGPWTLRVFFKTRVNICFRITPMSDFSPSFLDFFPRGCHKTSFVLETANCVTIFGSSQGPCQCTSAFTSTLSTGWSCCWATRTILRRTARCVFLFFVTPQFLSGLLVVNGCRWFNPKSCGCEWVSEKRLPQSVSSPPR